MRRSKRNPYALLAVNYASILKLTVLLWLLSMLFLNPIKEEEGIKKDAQYIITMTWDQGTDHDVDIWLELPDQSVCFYGHKEAGLINLERDDIGKANDYITMNGMKIENPLNQEIITFRGIVPGEYILNIDLYRYKDVEDVTNTKTLLPVPINVTITIQKVNPTVTVVFTKNVQLTEYLQELHITRFTIEPDGNMDNFNDTDPASLLTAIAEQNKKG